MSKILNMTQSRLWQQKESCVNRTTAKSVNWTIMVGWLVCCFGLNGPLKQYFVLYRAVSQREGERKREIIGERKNVQITPTRNHCKRSRPLPYGIGSLSSTIAPPDHPRTIMTGNWNGQADTTNIRYKDRYTDLIPNEPRMELADILRRNG